MVSWVAAIAVEVIAESTFAGVSAKAMDASNNVNNSNRILRYEV